MLNNKQKIRLFSKSKLRDESNISPLELMSYTCNTYMIKINRKSCLTMCNIMCKLEKIS